MTGPPEASPSGAGSSGTRQPRKGPSPEVTLRAVLPEDLPIFYEHQRDPQATRMAAFPPRDRGAFDAHWEKIMCDDSLVKLTILSGSAVAGNAVSFVRNGRREVGYWIGREFWGRGIATAALRALLERITERPLHAGVAKHNVASLSVLEKCGFTISCEEKWSPPTGGDDVDDYILILTDGAPADAPAPGVDRV